MKLIHQHRFTRSRLQPRPKLLPWLNHRTIDPAGRLVATGFFLNSFHVTRINPCQQNSKTRLAAGGRSN